MKLPRFDKARVLTLGDAMLDRYWHGNTVRISAEAPVPVVDITEREDRLGGAANVALNVAALGASSTLVAVLGFDESAEILKAKLDSAGIVDATLGREDYQTITKLRIVSHGQQMVRADFEHIVDLEAAPMMPVYLGALAQTDLVILSDYDKGVISDPQAFIQQARALHKTILVDPKYKDFSLYAGATLIKPNRVEFMKAVGGWANEAELVTKCHAMIAKLGLEAILVTRDSDGLTLVQKNQPAIHMPARKREVFDLSGAGDTVIATLGAALAAGETLPDAVNMANVAAGIAVSKPGIVSVSGPELRHELSHDQRFDKGIMNEDQLLLAAAEARSRGERVVFTNGCFDILHAGHVDYLAEARQRGDRLVVAINSDESVHRLKGEGRPINTVDRRMAMLAGLSAVDWVVTFEHDTPLALLEKLRPDVLVKGGDYGIEQVVGGDMVRAYGGEVAVLSLVEDCSTTAIVEKIRNL
ncbi:bifunctional D-glycero-beta-D-manno-heptose-7-phosphate kinase/D-glycero-beta-D-manno-heptose 1-phosphate adenylyltransferase HldE [Pseudomonadales bacterium]|nr:bifunctional D-glycero-beta-D-manno-heptose-7-phosphate kinase/D-glycero-beta-D-manno-heptose 1-phosphate adenylyltransferase HldE [Pseudomonadales bacterium]MDA9063783.1 bifunctional D-glycero-beta-D-manno-heptose-7-phosphate kinase/D-glycero-beta-D-manno-heptose 1-phosphate adenylyltransferase HldE [Pseudomonadales bacterium]MDB4151221.1 bifunctional D-glycero-beta-D-manno-heptose-7-phosphate kinase/D-glycero-beta-D-manno-heptose 1-phosphate adenylyltransferase HldE [Pseudomonadales bacteriu